MPPSRRVIHCTIDWVEDKMPDNRKNLLDFIVNLPLISYYHRIYYDIAVQMSVVGWPSLTEKRSGKNGGVASINYLLDELPDKPRIEFRKRFVKKVVDDLDITSWWKRGKLKKMGISEENAGKFFDYITSAKDSDGEVIIPTVAHEGEECSYSLGCIDTEAQQLLAKDDDHALPQQRHAGTEVHRMCSLHNGLKRDNLIFDHLSFRQFIE